MGKNREINERIRRSFGKVSAEAEERRQMALKDPEEMSDLELLEELSVVADRLAAVQAEMAARAEKAEEASGDEERA